MYLNPNTVDFNLFKQGGTMLKVTNLCKSFTDFSLKNVSFEVPSGAIVGFIGQNGAGKTTTLKCILRSVLPDEGEVYVCGLPMKKNETECKKLISFSSGTFEYYRNKKLCEIVSACKPFYSEWNDGEFKEYCRRFNLDVNKRVKELSAGTKVKFSLALAMSHNAKIFVFDEPTSGLDPIARDELLDIFRDIVADGDKSILFSTHITSDIEKCADYVLFIKDGAIIVNSPKDELLEKYAVVKGGEEELTDELTDRLVGYKRHSFGYIGLILRNNIRSSDKFVTEKPTLEDIMVYFNKTQAFKA